MSHLAHCRRNFGAAYTSPCSPPLRRVPALDCALEDERLLVLEGAFRSTGGIVSGDEMAAMLWEHTRQPISMVARWIVSREAVSFDWRSRRMLPLFQFDRSTLTLRTEVVDITKELRDVIDDWSLALWFARPNPWLRNAAPVSSIDGDPDAVRDAARADRFALNG